MINQNPYLHEFYANCEEIYKQVLNDKSLQETILETISDFPKLGSSTFYQSLDQHSLGLKAKDYFDGSIFEMAIMADLFNPDIRMSSFAVPVYVGIDCEHDFMEPLYLVKDLGNISSYIDSHSDEEYLYEEEKNMCIEKIKMRGYNEGLAKDNFRWSLFFDVNETNLFVVDIDQKNFDDSDHIEEGLENGKGKYSRLQSIWKHLDSNYALDLRKS